MPTPNIDTLNKLQPPPGGGVQLDTSAKIDMAENRQRQGDKSSDRALSTAALKQFVADHTALVGSMSLGSLEGTGAEFLAREKQQEQKMQDDEKSPYSIAAGMTQEQQNEAQEEKDAEAEREYDEHVLTGQELVQFNQTMSQVKQESKTNHDGLDKWKAANDKTAADIKSREIHVDGHNLVLDTATGQYYDVDSKKDLDPQKDAKLISDANKEKKPNSATKQQLDNLAASEQQQASAITEQQDADNQTTQAGTGPATGAKNKQLQKSKQETDDVQKKIQAWQAKVNADPTVLANRSAVQPQSSPPPSATNTPTTNSPPPSAPQNTIAATENKNVQTYNIQHSETPSIREAGIEQEGANRTSGSNSIQSMFAAYKANTQPNTTPSETTLTAKSFASSQSGLTGNADDKMQKLGAQMQTAFTAGAQGTSPVSSPAVMPNLANNGPALIQQTMNKKPAAPAIA